MSGQTALAVLLVAAVAAAGVLAGVVAALRRRSAILHSRVEQSAVELDRLQRAFARFAPAELVERIATDGVRAVGERRDVTVLFADIRGFTQLSERLDPSVVVPMLNGYFRAMSAVIQSHHGHVTRLMGDGIMSVFGALERNPWHVQDAVEAALDMRRALAAYNEELAAGGLPPLGFGVGVHCGVVVAGLVGSEELQEYTVMGDVVNVASRVEGLTRRLGVDILVTGEVHARTTDRFRMTEMPAADIRGKSQRIVTWAVEEARLPTLPHGVPGATPVSPLTGGG